MLMYQSIFLSRKDLSYLDKLIYIRIVGFCRNDKYNNKINNNKEIFNKIISYDTDGVMLWHGKRCESVEPTEEERREMEDLLSEFMGDDDLTNE